MFIYKKIVVLPVPVESVFSYITSNANFPLWLRDIWIAGRTMGKMGPGCSLIQTIRIYGPRKFNMKVTGYVQNRYFRIEALKGYFILPGFVFSFKPAKDGHTQLTVCVSVNGRILGEDENPKNLVLFYPTGVDSHWKVYLSLLEAALTKENA